jgi:hypothetical protein
MAEYSFDCTSFLGMSHCGSVTAEGEGVVELYDDEMVIPQAIIDLADLN